MPVSWEEGYRPDRLAQRIEENTIRDASGNVSFELFPSTEHEVLLCSMLKFPDGIPEPDIRKIVSNTMFEAAREGVVTPSALLKHANKLVSQYSSLPYQRYAMVSSVSLSQFVSLPSIRFGNAVIIFEPAPPPQYQKARDKLAMEIKHTLLADLPDNYLSVRVHVSAKSESEALNTAFHYLDLVRGTWNWFYNRQTRMRSIFGRRSPVNKIVLGPVSTLHYTHGGLTSPGWWYQTEYLGTVKVHDPSKQMSEMYKALAYVRRRLAVCSYRDDMEKALTGYARGLDLLDWEAGFLRLWSILELLTDTSKLSNEMTSSRAATVFQDVQSEHQVLRHLQRYRNRLVHANASNSKIETYLYQLKNFVEALLSFHLGNTYRFQSIRDAAAFLDLPSDSGALKARIRLLAYAAKFRGYQ